METNDTSRLGKPIAQNHLSRRTSALTARWASHGLAASALAPERYKELVRRLRSGRSGSLNWTDDLLGEMRAFVLSCDIVTIIGWNVDEEPALLVSAQTLVERLPATTDIYPDGFILLNSDTGKALIVDVDEDEGTQTNLIDLPSV